MLYVLPCQSEFSGRHERAAALHGLGERLLFHAVRQELGIGREELVLRHTAKGKPYFENTPIYFSISHCPGLVCCALSKKSVGVDAEAVSRCSPRLARRICTEGELAFLERSPDKDLALTVLWTLKESRMKQNGEGIRFGFQNAAFSFSGEFPCEVSPVGAPELSASSYIDVPGFVISICGEEAFPKELVTVKEDQLF